MREQERVRPQHSLGQTLLLLFLSGLVACAAEERQAELGVLKVVPDYGPGTGTRTDPQRLFLNSQVAVFFTQDLDPLSVTDDTLRLVKLTGDGGIVRLRSVTIHSRSVILEPEPPLTPGLEDGSLQPGQLYRLEIAGLPLTNTVSSLSGRPLLRHEYRYFYTVSATAEETDLPYPLLPPANPGDLELRRRPIQMAAASGRLDLHFTLPLVPATVRPEAFEVHCIRRGTAQAERLVLASTLVVSRPQPLDPYPGCTVRLVLEDAGAVQSGDAVYVLVKQEQGVRDYRDRGLSGAEGGFCRVLVYEGPKPPLLRLPGRNAADSLRFEAVAPDRLSFECVEGREPGEGAWIQPLARREAGYGSHGVFHPKSSMVLEPMRDFKLGNGQTQACGPAFNFQGIHIPKGVTVTVRSQRPVQLRATGAVRIEGVLELDTPVPEGKARLSDLRSPAALCAYAPVTLIAADSVQVAGSIRRKGQTAKLGPGAPLAVIATAIELQGRVPFHTILAVPKRGRVTGPAQSATVVELTMEYGLPPDTAQIAEAYTEWRQLPPDFSGNLRARAEDVQGDLEVYLQVAAPDPTDSRRPYLDPSALPRPLPLPAGPLQVLTGFHVRFLLRGQVSDSAVPRLRALVVEAD